MYKLCVTEKTARQQRLFEQCLLETMKKMPFADITVIGLCEQAGLSRKVFYRLFGGKHDVLCALIDHVLMDYESFLPPKRSTDAAVPESLRRFFAYWLYQKDFLDVLAANGLSTLLMERVMIHVSGEESHLLRIIGADGKKNAEETLAFFLCGIMGLVVYWHHSGYQRPVDELAVIAKGLLQNPPLHFSE